MAVIQQMAKTAYRWQNCKQMAAIAYTWQKLCKHGIAYEWPNCSEMAAAVAYRLMAKRSSGGMIAVDYERQTLRTHIAKGAYTWHQLLTNGNRCL
jgi:hypothetical protein